MLDRETKAIADMLIVTDDILIELIGLLIRNGIISYESIHELFTELAEDDSELSGGYKSRLKELKNFKLDEELHLKTQLADTIKKLNAINESQGKGTFKLVPPSD